MPFPRFSPSGDFDGWYAGIAVIAVLGVLAFISVHQSRHHVPFALDPRAPKCIAPGHKPSLFDDCATVRGDGQP